MRGTSTGWDKYKELATANKVKYKLFQYRVYSGMPPEEAATLAPGEKQTRNDLSHLKGKEIKTDGPMSRKEALEQIDIQTLTFCDPCETRIEMYKRYKNNSSKLEKICNNECPVGKQIQALSEYLTVGPRKEPDRAWNR